MRTNTKEVDIMLVIYINTGGTSIFRRLCVMYHILNILGQMTGKNETHYLEITKINIKDNKNVKTRLTSKNLPVDHENEF